MLNTNNWEIMKLTGSYYPLKHMVHLSNFFHLPSQQRSNKRAINTKSCSVPGSRRNSRDSSSATSSAETTFEEGRNWLYKQLHLHQQSQQSTKSDLQLNNSKSSGRHQAVSAPATPPLLSPSVSKQTVATVKSVDSQADTTSTSGTMSNKLHKLNTANLREYGECYKRLGKGSTAVISICRSKTVFSTSNKPDAAGSTKCSKLYAIKQFRKRNKNETEKEYMKKLTSEFCISSTFHHVNIVETIDLVLDDQQRYCTVMEYCPGGDLFSAIMSEHMTNIEMSCCFKQMIQGLAYLHSVGVAHRDIKPENLLLTLDGKLKITDFGVSDVFRCVWEKTSHKSRGLVGSEPYIAPEAFEKSHEYWGANADIWSAGVVLYAMYRGGHAWIKADQKSDKEYRFYLRHYAQRTFPNFSKLPDPIRRMLYLMLDPNPNTRVTAQQILEDDWVRNVLICEKGIDALNRDHHHTNLSCLKNI
ncbi:kinase-like domain-containing protein [Mycotypha africana]|uniref:kinase-like domain-containing protein n=1 Tax=Mycotypha africana TaxID=64632 RepID=UPI0023011383|nr:kinase-like domain-containing protein [Mycotypha africana]KAI8977040.1 kinase-like domain-containing protein [Mycotypha africana]